MTSETGRVRCFAAFVIRGAVGETWLETTINMPSKKKKRVRERMKKTGESYSTALRNISRVARIKHGRYSGNPRLPQGPTTEHFDAEGRHLPDVRFPQVELVNIQGDFDLHDLKKAWVPETAFDDPNMPQNPAWQKDVPRDVKRVLTLAEYIDARARQTGWTLERVEGGPLVLMGKPLSVLLRWGPGSGADGGSPS